MVWPESCNEKGNHSLNDHHHQQHLQYNQHPYPINDQYNQSYPQFSNEYPIIQPYHHPETYQHGGHPHNPQINDGPLSHDIVLAGEQIHEPHFLPASQQHYDHPHQLVYRDGVVHPQLPTELSPFYYPEISPHNAEVVQSSLHPHQYEGRDYGGGDDDDDDDDDDVPYEFKTLKEALQDIEVHLPLPRLAVLAPPSVMPAKGGGRCRLPNLGNTCYMNAVLQCMYHTTGFTALLAHSYADVDGRGDHPVLVSQALVSITSRMDDVRRMKRGVLAYFKGVCGLKNEHFASFEQQEALEFMSFLLTWLHKELGSQDELDCACTKSSSMKRLLCSPNTKTTAITNSDNGKNNHCHNLIFPQDKHDAPQPPSQPLLPPSQPLLPPLQTNWDSHYYPPINRQQPSKFTMYTGSNHQINHNNRSGTHSGIFREDSHQQQRPREGINTVEKHNEAIPTKHALPSSETEIGKVGEKCKRCGVICQRWSFVSDMFEGILQSEIICGKMGVILNSTNQRFTSLSVPVTTAAVDDAEVTLEALLQKYFAASEVDWECDYCCKTHLCLQKTTLLCAPPVLLLHLSRVTDRHNPRKQRVDFPAEGLTLEEHMSPVKQRRSKHHRYNLHAVCNHQGFMHSGHYVAFCRANKSHVDPGSWWFFDDEEVALVTHHEYLNWRESHILFYASQC